MKHRSNSAAYLQARLRRDEPKIADALERGEFPSVRAAAIEADIIKPVRRLVEEGLTPEEGAKVLQLAITQAKAQPLAAVDAPGPGRGHKTLDNINPLQGGTSQAYLLRRIARDQPQLLDQIGPDKEFHSVRAAAIEAGIKHGGDRRSPQAREDQASDRSLKEGGLHIVQTTEHGHGNNAAYLAARLKKAGRDDLLDQIGPDKEFHSVRAAAIASASCWPWRSSCSSGSSYSGGQRQVCIPGAQAPGAVAV